MARQITVRAYVVFRLGHGQAKNQYCHGNGKNTIRQALQPVQRKQLDFFLPQGLLHSSFAAVSRSQLILDSALQW